MIFAFLKMKQITILFVDDHPLIRKAWDFLLRQDARFKLIGVCDSGEMAIEASIPLIPRILISIITMSGYNFFETSIAISPLSQTPINLNRASCLNKKSQAFLIRG